MNVKPDDLAIQIRSVTGNEGKIVKILGPMGITPFYDGSYWHHGEGFCWMAEYQNKAKCNKGKLLKIMPIPDSWLRPISGLPDHDEVENKQPIKEIA